MDRCDGCHASDGGLAPILTDAAWAKIAKPGETLCAKCFFERAIERKIDLTLADLQPCPFNVFHSPRSWFDLFMSREKEPPPNIEEWRETVAGLGLT